MLTRQNKCIPCTVVAGLLALGLTGSAQAQVKISQVYGAGGNTQSPVLNDYIEIYNTGAPQDLTGWSVQYAASTGLFSAANTTALPAIILGTGQYLLVQESNGGTLLAGQTPALPTAQVSAAIAMSATDFKVALVSSTAFIPTALGQPTYAGVPTLVDFVGVGTLANWNDSAAAGGANAVANNAPPCSTAHANYRAGCGATDTNNSRNDWGVGLPAPRNTATAVNGGITSIGTALPLTLEELQTARLTATPFRCATSDLGAGTTVSINTALIGGGVLSMLDDGVAPDEVISDGVYTALVTVAAGTSTGTKNLPVTVGDGGGNSGGSYISIEVKPTTTPDNDNCYTAQAISGPFPASVTATLLNATAESNPFATASSAPTSGFSARRGLWYTVVGTGNTMTAALCSTLPAFDSVLFVMCGSCDGLTIVSTGDDSGPACTGTQASASWCSAAGQTYYVWVAPFASGAAATPGFTLQITDGAACTTAFACTTCLGVSGPYTETEPGYGSHTNDGCGSTPNRFTDIAEPSCPGTTLRGAARGMIGNRDVDSYRFMATSNNTITITMSWLGAVAQGQLVSLAAGGVCPQSAIIVSTPVLLARCGTSSTSSTVTAGTWYAVQVVGGVGLQLGPTAGTVFGGQMPGGSTYQYTLNVGIGCPPANDSCASATAIAGNGSSAGTTQNATSDGTASCEPGGGNPDVWYSYAVGTGCDGVLSLNTCTTATNPIVSVYTGACGALTEVVCNDDCGGPTPCTGPPGSCVSLPATGGTTYRIRVATSGGTGTFTLAFSFAVPAPANDTCASAASFPIAPIANPCGGSSTVTGCYQGATADTPAASNASCDSGLNQKDVYHSFTPAVTGSYSFNLCTSPLSTDTVVSVHSNTCPVTDATQVVAGVGGCNDDGCGPVGGLSVLNNVSLTAGTTYIVRVAGWSSTIAGGPYTLVTSLASGNTNDACASATALVGTSGTVSGNTACGTSDGTASCETMAGNPDLWYTITTPTGCAGTWNLNTCTASTDTILSVYSGACGSLTEVACNPDCGGSPCGGPGSCVSFAATAGTVYRVRVASEGAAGSFTLARSFTIAVPANDLCASAEVVVPGTITRSNCGAATDGANSCQTTATSDVWFSYTPTCTYSATLNTCGTHDLPGLDLGMDTVLSVHSGCPGTAANQLTGACNDDAAAGLCTGLDAGILRDSSVTVTLTKGVPVRIRVASFSTSVQGTFKLTITAPPADTTPPVISTCAANTTVFVDASCVSPPMPDLTSQVVATDNCVGALTTAQNPLPGSALGALGSMTVVTFTVTDAASNTATCTATVTVADNINRVINNCGSIPTQNKSVDAACQYTLEDLTGLVAYTENCPGATLSQSPMAGTSLGLGPQAVTVTLTDSSGNSASCIINVNVQDTTPPMITTCASDDTVAGSGCPCEASVPSFTGAPLAATDNCPGTVTFSQSPLAATLVGPGDTTVTITATDAAGNTATCTATLHVLPCPLASIATANPPNGHRDTLENTNTALAPEGIGVPGTPNEGSVTDYGMPTVTFDTTPCPAPAAGNVSVGCTGGSCPTVTAVTGSGAGPYTLTLSGQIPVLHCTTITFAGTVAGQKLQYSNGPGDINLNGLITGQDVLAEVTAINTATTILSRHDTNRNGNVTGQDVLRLVQLLNGVLATQAFNGASVANCP